MNRREVLMSAGATAIAVRGFVPFASALPVANAPVSVELALQMLTRGVRGTFTLNGTIGGLYGLIPPVGVGTGSSASGTTNLRGTAVSGSNAAAIVQPVAVQAAPVAAAPARAPMMSIVRVPRSSATDGQARTTN